jgi:DNA polymerase sigma
VSENVLSIAESLLKFGSAVTEAKHHKHKRKRHKHRKKKKTSRKPAAPPTLSHSTSLGRVQSSSRFQERPSLSRSHSEYQFEAELFEDLPVFDDVSVLLMGVRIP